MTSLPNGISPEKVFGLKSPQEFNEMALRIFHYQQEHNSVYKRFLETLNRPDPVHWQDIPCLPISAFKTHEVVTARGAIETVFTSSGTTGSIASKHHVRDLAWYEESFMSHFELRYGRVQDVCILGLLPSYLERTGSSLVYMVDQLIARSGHPKGGTYLYDHERLMTVLEENAKSGQPTILIGVTYALLDLVESYQIKFPELIVMETGGMKGNRKEIIREELHSLLKAGFGVEHIHSEYGMTELLSQAYSTSDGRYQTPPWMQVKVRDIMDPFSQMTDARTGGLDIIDLTNVHSCSFIATDDLARQYADGSFEVLGRFDVSDVRGCSLMI